MAVALKATDSSQENVIILIKENDNIEEKGTIQLFCFYFSESTEYGMLFTCRNLFSPTDEFCSLAIFI